MPVRKRHDLPDRVSSVEARFRGQIQTAYFLGTWASRGPPVRSDSRSSVPVGLWPRAYPGAGPMIRSCRRQNTVLSAYDSRTRASEGPDSANVRMVREHVRSVEARLQGQIQIQISSVEARFRGQTKDWANVGDGPGTFSTLARELFGLLTPSIRGPMRSGQGSETSDPSSSETSDPSSSAGAAS